MKKSTIRLVGILLVAMMLLPLVSCGGRMRAFNEAQDLLEAKGYQVTALPLFISGNLGNTLLADAGFPIDTKDLEWVVEGEKKGTNATVFILAFSDEAAADKGIEAFKNEFFAQPSAAANDFEVEEIDNVIYCMVNGGVHMMLKKDGNIVYYGTKEVTDVIN